MHPDLLRLYSLLGLPPDRPADELQRAYRRALAELHPDRAGAATDTPDRQALLRELIALHARVAELNGRAGAPSGSQPAEPATAAPGERPSAVGAGRAVAAAAPAGKWIVAAVLLLFVAWRLYDPTLPKAPEAEAVPAAAGRQWQAPAGAPVELLHLGMDAERVLAIQGQPERRGSRIWHYGPSWLHFEDDRLVDWYSSPLHRLQTATPVPPPD